jgi:hypothetical protein
MLMIGYTCKHVLSCVYLQAFLDCRHSLRHYADGIQTYPHAHIRRRHLTRRPLGTKPMAPRPTACAFFPIVHEWLSTPIYTSGVLMKNQMNKTQCMAVNTLISDPLRMLYLDLEVGHSQGGYSGWSWRRTTSSSRRP